MVGLPPARYSLGTLIAHMLAGIEQHTGRRPIGWMGPSLTETHNTVDLLAEQGLRYVADWINDEQPHMLRTDHGDLMAMPYTSEINDIGIFLRRGFTELEYQQLLCDQFDELYEDAQETARVMCITLHPYLVGVPISSAIFTSRSSVVSHELAE